VKLYPDEDISPKVSEILRKKGMDAVSAHEADMLQMSDKEQLTFAADDGRVMVTRNRDDFITLTVQFFEDLKPHNGLIIVPHTIPGSEFSKLASLLAKFAKKYPKGLESYTIEYLLKK
jgi:predicted nuclease of predicted toxin-antitoxin system